MYGKYKKLKVIDEKRILYNVEDKYYELVKGKEYYEIKRIICTSPHHNLFLLFPDVKFKEIYLPKSYPKDEFLKDYEEYKEDILEIDTDMIYEDGSDQILMEIDKSYNNNIYWCGIAVKEENYHLLDSGIFITRILKTMSYIQSAYLNNSANIDYIVCGEDYTDITRDNNIMIVKNIKILLKKLSGQG